MVNAGGDQTITLPTNAVTLDGTITDEGLPNPPGSVTALWRQERGAGVVTFAAPNGVATTALRPTAEDSHQSAFDKVTVLPSCTSSLPVTRRLMPPSI